MGVVTLAGLPERGILLVDSAPIIYVLGEHPTHASVFRPVFEAHENNLVRLAVTTITVAKVLTGPLKTRNEVVAAL